VLCGIIAKGDRERGTWREKNCDFGGKGAEGSRAGRIGGPVAGENIVIVRAGTRVLRRKRAAATRNQLGGAAQIEGEDMPQAAAKGEVAGTHTPFFMAQEPLLKQSERAYGSRRTVVIDTTVPWQRRSAASPHA